MGGCGSRSAGRPWCKEARLSPRSSQRGRGEHKLLGGITAVTGRVRYHKKVKTDED